MIRAGLLAVVLLAGCAPTAEPRGLLGRLWHLEVGPRYRPPAVDVPEEFRLAPAEAASIADLDWWEVFEDPALRRLIGDALDGNYDLQQAVARVEQSRALVGVAASQLYPQVGYQGSASRERSVLSTLTGTPGAGAAIFNVFAATLNVAWEIDVWGRIRRSTEAALATFLASEDARRGVVVSLVADVASEYFGLLELDRELTIAQDSAAAWQRTLEFFTRRFRGGTDTRISVARAEANLQASLAAIAALDRAIVQQENALSVLLGTNPHAIERGTPLVDQTTPPTPPGLPSTLLRRRPDILQAEQTMIGANAQIGVAVASFFPRVGLSAMYGGEANRIEDVLKDSFSVWNIAGNVSGPLFQGGNLVESYYAQRAFWDEAIARYRATVVEAFREVGDGLAARATLARERGAQEKQVAALQDAVRLALLRYNTGLANYLEVLEAQQQLYPAEDQLAQTQRDELVAVVTLYRALGGGWNTTGERVVAR